MKRMFPLGVFLLFALAASADTIIVGYNYGSTNLNEPVNLGTVQTDIALGNPATVSGTVDTVHLRWSAACTAAVKIKFFRRSGDTFTMIAERGPFNTVAGDNTITLTSPVAVQQGDLIGSTRLSTCGVQQVSGAPPIGVKAYAAFEGDVTGSINLSAGTTPTDYILSLNGSATTSSEAETLKAVIPVVGSTAGSFGAVFKTALQIHVNGDAPFTGRLVFHRQGVSGSDSDPSFSLSIAAGKTVDYTDIVAAMGQSGLGSIDLLAPASVSTPVLVVRVYNDAGILGTSGFIEDVVRNPASSPRVLGTGSVSYILTPADLTRARLNVGVRTLAGGATLSVTVKNSDGTIARTVTRTYVANDFEQVDAVTFTGGGLSGDQSIQVRVLTGSAIVYGAVTDNTTNDPAVQFADPSS